MNQSMDKYSKTQVPLKLLLNPVHCLSLGFGSGLAPKMPGTMGTLIGVLLFILLTTHAAAHSGGINKQGCHAGSQPYHCHKAQEAAPSTSSDQTVLTGRVTHVRDGDTIEVNGTPICLAALDCPERGTRDGDYATKHIHSMVALKCVTIDKARDMVTIN